MDQVTQQNAAMVEQSTAASHSLTSESRQLSDLVQRFSLTRETALSSRAPAAPAPRKPSATRPLTARRLGETGRTIVASPTYLARRGVPYVPEDLHHYDCLNFNFPRLEPVWPFRRDGRDYALTVRGPVQANNGESLTQLALAGVGVTRVGNFSVADAIAKGELVPLLEDFNPGDLEPIHALFVGGASIPARIRVFVDYLVDQLRPRSVARDATEVGPSAGTG